MRCTVFFRCCLAAGLLVGSGDGFFQNAIIIFVRPIAGDMR